MAEVHDPLALYLGGGGAAPRIELIGLESDPWSMRPPCSLPPGQSVYALAPAPTGGGFVAGSKTGQLRLFAADASPCTEPPPLVREWNHGAAIVSLCWLDSSHLAVGDTLGRLLIWDTECLEHPPATLRKGAGVACALWATEGRRLIALLSGGDLLEWSWPEGNLIKTNSVPAPPSKYALIHLTHWPAAGVLAYPARGGQLVLYDLDDGEISAREAHEGNFFAAAPLGERLLTAGYDDPFLRQWSKDSLHPLAEERLDEGTLALCPIDPLRGLLLRIAAGGQASVCLLEEGRLKVISRLTGKDYRVAVGPSSDQIDRALRRQAEAEATGLLKTGREMVARGRWDELEPHIERLFALGRPGEAQRLRLERALARGNALEELEARVALSRLAGAGGNASEQAALGRLLERFALHEMALSVYKQIPAPELGAGIQERLRELEFCRAAWAEGRGVVDVEKPVPLRDTLAAAAFLECRFTQRWPIARGHTIPCRGVALAAEQIQRKCESVLAEGRHACSPQIRLEHLCWMGRERSRWATALVFYEPSSEDLSGLEVALRLDALEGETIVSPYLLLAPPRLTLPDSPQEHSQTLLRHYETLLSRCPLCDGWYGQVLRLALESLGRLANERRGSRREA